MEKRLEQEVGEQMAFPFIEEMKIEEERDLKNFRRRRRGDDLIIEGIFILAFTAMLNHFYYLNHSETYRSIINSVINYFR